MAEDISIGVYPERIAQAIEQSGQSKVEVARRMGVSDTTVQWWCSGERTPSAAKVALLAHVTRTPVGFFFGEDGGVSPTILQEAENWRRVKDLLTREGILTNDGASSEGARKAGTEGDGQETGAFLYQTTVRPLVPSGNENLSRRPSSDRLCGAAS